MACIIDFYNIRDWFDSAFTNKEKEYIKKVIPILNEEDYTETSKPLFLALTDCFIRVSFLPRNIWETKLHIPVDKKVFDKALSVFYESESTPIEKHLFYNAVIDKRSFMGSIYDDPLIKKLCIEQIENSEKAREDFLAKKIKLGKHEGYSYLIRIYKSKDEKKCKELCNEAIKQGWQGGWKRTLNSIIDKEEQQQNIASGNDVIYKKRLPLEDEDFSTKYWDKNNKVFFPARDILENEEPVFFRVYNNSSLAKCENVESIEFKRGDIFVSLDSGSTIKIPMNMIMTKSYVSIDNDKFSAIFEGSDNWKVSEDYDVPDCSYMLTSFENDDDNPLLNENAPREDERNLGHGVTRTRNGFSFSLDDFDDDEFENEDFDDEESTDDSSMENWNKFFEIMNEKNDNEELLIVSIFHNDEDNDSNIQERQILSGELQEINVDDDNFTITVNDNIIEIEESLEELDVIFPEDSKNLFGLVPCTCYINGEIIDALIAFASFNEDEEEE